MVVRYTTTYMPTTIIIRIDDENEARSALAAGARDLAESFLPDACIRADKVTLIYRTPEDEALAQAGLIGWKEHRSQWVK